MARVIPHLVALVAALSVIVATLGGGVSAEAIKCISKSNPLDASASYFPPSMRIAADDTTAGAADVEVAGSFSVHYDNSFKVAQTICGKHQPAGCKPKTYVLRLCGSEKPTMYANGTALPVNATHFSVPLRAVALAGGITVANLEMLGLLDKVEVVDPNTVHSPCLQKLEEEGNITTHKAGSSWDTATKANWTKLIDEHPRVDGAFTDSWNTGSTGTAKDIVFDGSADSSGALGRAEWIKFMSLFFNDEDKANLYFKREQDAWNAKKAAIVAIKAKPANAAKQTRTCAWGGAHWSGKFQVSFTTYKTDLCKAVGLVPHTNDTLIASGTYSQLYDTTAEFHAALAGFDVFIDESYFPSPSTTDKAAVLTKLNITGMPKAGAILLRTDGHVSDTVSSSTSLQNLVWYESAAVRPALVLEDLAAMVWPGDATAVPAGCDQYFRNVLAGEMPVVHGKDSCAVFEAAEKEAKCITNALTDADVDRSNLVPPPPPAATVTVVGSVTLEGYTEATFKAAEQVAFKTGIAKIAKVTAADVTITIEHDHSAHDGHDHRRRRLLEGDEVIVNYAIAATDTTAADAIAKSIEDTPAATVVTEMKAAGLTKVTGAKVTVSKTRGKPGEKPVLVKADAPVFSGAASMTTAVVYYTATIFAILATMATV